MVNFLFYEDKLRELLFKKDGKSAVDDIINIMSKDMGRELDSDKVRLYLADFLRWALKEHVDWDSVKPHTKIQTRYFGEDEWDYDDFACYIEGKVYVFDVRASNYPPYGDIVLSPVDEARLPDIREKYRRYLDNELRVGDKVYELLDSSDVKGRLTYNLISYYYLGTLDDRLLVTSIDFTRYTESSHVVYYRKREDMLTLRDVVNKVKPDNISIENKAIVPIKYCDRNLITTGSIIVDMRLDWLTFLRLEDIRDDEVIMQGLNSESINSHALISKDELYVLVNREKLYESY